MFKTREDGSILYAPNGWWSKKTYVLPSIELKKRIRYINMLIGFLLAVLLLIAFFSAKLLWVFSALIFVAVASILHKRFERTWLINCEQVDEKVTLIDVYQEKWLVPETRRWKRFLDAIAPIMCAILISLVIYLMHFGVKDEVVEMVRETALLEPLTAFLSLYLLLLLCFVPALYYQSHMAKAVRSIIVLFMFVSTLLIIVLCSKVTFLISTSGTA